MSETKKVPFKEVRSGQIFIGKTPMDNFYGARIESAILTHKELGDISLEFNVVIISRSLSQSIPTNAGILIIIEPEEIVEVSS